MAMKSNVLCPPKSPLPDHTQLSEGDWMFAIAVFVLGSLGFSAANVFYDSLIVNVASAKQLDLVSGFC